eukprot:16143506-Heterocapsa_arctica.AAC.1
MAGDLSVVASFCRDLISWPEKAGGAPLESCLPDGERTYLAEDGAKLKLPAEVLSLREASG